MAAVRLLLRLQPESTWRVCAHSLEMRDPNARQRWPWIVCITPGNGLGRAGRLHRSAPLLHVLRWTTPRPAHLAHVKQRYERPPHGDFRPTPLTQWALPPLAGSHHAGAGHGLRLLRMLKGPPAQDRVLALDCTALNGILLLMLVWPALQQQELL